MDALTLLLAAVLCVFLVVAVELRRLTRELTDHRREMTRLRTTLQKFSPPSLLACALALSGGQRANAESPSDGVAMALLDARLLHPEVAKNTRYLHYLGYSDADLPLARRVLAGHVNFLSRGRDVLRPRRVSETVDALYLPDYYWDATVFGNLAQPKFSTKGLNTQFSDQYYHVYLTENGKTTPRGAPWCNPAAVKELEDLCQSRVPIVRADWFFYQTAIQADRDGHGYYDFLGLGRKEDDFLRLIGADPKKVFQLRLEMAGVVGISQVAFNNRGVRWEAALTGGHWFTEDYFSSVDRQNVVRLPEGYTVPPHGDASEHYGHLANGLFAMFLNDKNGVRQDSVPDRIARDKETTNNDGRVHCYMSCVRCHKEGLRPIDDYGRKVYRDHGPSLGSADPEQFLRWRQLYLGDLKYELNRNVSHYSNSLSRATGGLSPEQYAEAVKTVWAHYERPVSVDQAASELGVSTEVFRGKLRSISLQPSANLDPVLAGFLVEPPIPMLRAHWEEVYFTAQTYVMPRQFIQPQPVVQGAKP